MIMQLPVENPSGQTIDTTYTRQRNLLAMYNEFMESKLEIYIENPQAISTEITLKAGSTFNFWGTIKRLDYDLKFSLDAYSGTVDYPDSYISYLEAGSADPYNVESGFNLLNTAGSVDEIYQEREGIYRHVHRVDAGVKYRPLTSIIYGPDSLTQNHRVGTVSYENIVKSWKISICRWMDPGIVLPSSIYQFTYSADDGTSKHRYARLNNPERWVMSGVRGYSLPEMSGDWPGQVYITL